MKEIVFKVKDNKLNIIVDSSISNKEFLSLLKERLERLIVLKDSIAKEVVLDIENKKLDNREILELFDILNDINIFYISKVICKKQEKEKLSIYRGNFRGGQIRFFDKSMLLIGTINKGSKLVVNGDLYVLGKVNGDVELKDKSKRFYCESIKESIVKIGDSYRFFKEELNSKEIYFQNGEIKVRDYKKGENINVKSNSCYIG